MKNEIFCTGLPVVQDEAKNALRRRFRGTIPSLARSAACAIVRENTGGGKASLTEIREQSGSQNMEFIIRN